MTVSLRGDERSEVTTHAYDLPRQEEVEHLTGVDLYHFPAWDGARIQLTIHDSEEIQEAWYSVHGHSIVEEQSQHFWVDIMQSSESRDVKSLVPEAYANWQEALDDALDHYQNKIPGWFYMTRDGLDTTLDEHHQSD